MPSTAAELFRSHRVGMVRLAYVLTGDSAVADEIVQDAFMKVHTHWDRIDNPIGYLRTTVVNGCRSHHRRRVLEERHASSGPVATVQSPDEIGDILASLPERQRIALALRYFLDLPDNDIAQALGARPSTVRSLIRRGLAALREELDP
jgi:RNA polymerase sigma-70 factor (sigma-E family)